MTAAGYSGKALWQKLGLTPWQRCRIVDCPLDYAALTAAPHPLQQPDAAPFDVIHAFVADRAALERGIADWHAALADGGMLWISWPKKTSKRFRDLTEDGIREIALPRGLVDVKVCAVDADWSGLKLMRRK